MNIERLQERLGDSFDLESVEDCRKVIDVLLRDKDIAHRKADTSTTQLRLLANLVIRGRTEAFKKKAEEVIKGLPKPDKAKLWDGLQTMCNHASESEGMQDKALVDAIFDNVWGDLDFTGRPAALLEELIRRFSTLAGLKKE